jgi:UDPglucose 6-dehydrogenase
MKIAVIGTGYVGLTSGTCLAETGNDVVCADIDERKINQLNNNKCPLYEPGLHELIERNTQNGRLSFTSNIKSSIERAGVVMVCVGTPSDENGDADISQVIKTAEAFGKYINGYKMFIVKSTVPVGTTHKCKMIILNEIKNRNTDYEFDVVSNPEFLRQGAAVKDTMYPERIIAGVENERSSELLNKLYSPMARTGRPVVYTDIKSAEVIKYAANAFLCTKISFINEMAQFCEQAGANIRDVAHGIGLDSRIGARFLHAGIGYGGNCLKKDINSLINTGKSYNHQFSILQTVEAVNEMQKNMLLKKLEDNLKKLKNKKIAVWGLSFKPKTDDLRDAPSIDIVGRLLESKSSVKIYDPLSGDSFIKSFFKGHPNLTLSQSNVEAARNADAVMVLTEWDEFRNVDFKKLKKEMKGNLFLDGRNIYNPDDVRKADLKYIGIGVN